MDVEKLKAIIAALQGTDVMRLVYRSGEERLVIQRGAAGTATPVAMAAPAQARSPEAHPPRVETVEKPAPGHVITSPFVGTFYRSPSPEQASFVEVGQVVRKGQTLCIIEAMKLMNEIEAEVSGKVAECFAQNGQPVEFGQPLFRVEPA